MSEKAQMWARYTIEFKPGNIEVVEADTFGIAEGFFMFMKQNFTKDFGIVMTSVAAYRQEEVKNIRGELLPPPKPTLDLVTKQ